MSKIDPSEEFMWEDTGANDNPFYAADQAAAPPGRFRRLFRRLTRNAGRILLLWLVISSVIVYGIYRLVEPTYQAYSMIKVESYEPELFGDSLMARDGSSSPLIYLQSEIESIRSNPVLDLALSDSSIAKCSVFRDSLDPRSRSADARSPDPSEHTLDPGSHRVQRPQRGR